MTACSSVVVVAGLVAAVAVATDGDRVQRDRAALVAAGEGDDAGDEPAGPSAGPASPVADARPAAAPVAPGTAEPAPGRVLDPLSGAGVTPPPGWREVPAQRLVPVPPERFGTVLAAGERAVVLVGALDPTRVGVPASARDLEAEARRLAAAFGDGAAPSATRLTPLRDDAAGVAGRTAFTSLRRADGGDRRTAGALVRVTTVDAAPGARSGVVVLAVVAPGPAQSADARAAEEIVRSLAPVRRQVAPGPARPASGPPGPAAGGAARPVPGRPAPTPGPAAPRQVPPSTGR